MAVVRRPDSPFWWMNLERPGLPPLRRSTKIPVAGATPDQVQENKRLAQAVYAARMGDLARGREGLPVAQTSALTFTAFTEWYDRHKIAHHAGREREREMLVTLRRAFGPKRLTEITRQLVEEWMTARAAIVSPRTVNREVDLLKAILKSAAALGHISASPIAGMKELRYVKPKRRLMRLDEERKLLRAATDPVDRAMLILGVDTLVRLGDLLELRREDRAGVWLYIRSPKDPVQSEPYTVPLTKRAAAALDAIPATGPYYFQKFRVQPLVRDRRRDVRLMLERLCRRARVPYGRKRGGLTFHWATRTTGATRLIVDRKVDPRTVQQLGHWKHSAIVMEIYTESNRTALLAAVGRRPRTSRARRGPR